MEEACLSSKEDANTISGLTVPPSKSQSMRALLFAAMAEGESRIDGLLDSPDVAAFIEACRSLGASLRWENETLVVEGVAGRPIDCDREIDAANSGILLRFVGAIAALSNGRTVISGDASLNARPIDDLAQGLRELGADVNGPPLSVSGPIRPGTARLVGEDSQPVSSLLIACSFLDGPSELIVERPGEMPWIDVTLSWLGDQVEHTDYRHYRIRGGHRLNGFSYRVPGDFSSAAFPLALALVRGRNLTLTNLDFHDAQGDKLLIDVLREMGARIDVRDGEIAVRGGSLRGMEIDVNPMIDAIPILAVIGCFAEGETRLINGRIARTKECDRIRAICTELKKMGADIEEQEDGVTVRCSPLSDIPVDSHGDHRIAMALHVAGATEIAGTECIAKTYPNFFEAMQCI